MSNTVGLVYRAGTGSVDPWTLDQIKEETATNIRRAAAGDRTRAENDIKTANAEIDRHLKAIDAHPDEAALRIPVLGKVGSPEFLAQFQKLILSGLFVVGGALAFYFFFVFLRSISRRR